MAAFIVFIIILVTYPFTLMWKAYVLITMWTWFLQPITGHAAPSIYVTAGALLMLSLALYRPSELEKQREPIDSFSAAMSYGFALPAFALGCAWVWKWLQWGLA